MGNEAAFVRLWRDANPMLTRYLRVAGVTDPRESARHAWVGAIRDLSSFSGDEIAWHGWVLGLARGCVDEDAASHGRGTRTHRPSRSGGHRGGGEDRSAVPQVEPAELRGLNDTIAAIRDLPLGQGEILMLRLVGELPVARVAELVGSDVVAVRRSEDRAVERLGAERELLAWSLAAPALPEELADQRIALTAFRGRNFSSSIHGSTRVLAVRPGPQTRKPNTPKPITRNPHAAHTLTLHPHTGKPPTVVRSRMAMLCIAAVSASAMSVGALSAAAYVGVLPPALQQVMHNAIGAPAVTTPAHLGPSPSGQASSGARRPFSGAGARATAPHPTARVGAVLLPAATARRSGAGTPPPRDAATHGNQAAKTQSGKTQSGKAKSAHTSKPTSTSSVSRTPAAKPTAGVARPAKGQAASAHPANPTASHRVPPATAHADGQASMSGVTGSPRP